MDEIKLPNGTFTITNRETGEYRTFRVRTQPADSKFAPGERVLALLSGPDNGSDYQPFAFVNPDRIAVWRKKRGRGGGRSAWETYASLIWALCVVEDPRVVDKYEAEVSKRCLRCNRKLTTPASLALNIGPECAAALGLGDAWEAAARRVVDETPAEAAA